MMKVTLLLLLMMMVAGCATIEKSVPLQAKASEIGAKATPYPDPPAIALSGDLLYKILEADIAMHYMDFKTATQGYLALAKITKDPRIADSAVRIANHIEDNGSLLEALTLLNELVPDNEQVLYQLASLHLRAGMPARAEPYVDILMDKDPEDAQVLFLYGKVLLASKQPEQALVAFEAAYEQRPDWYEIADRKARTLVELRRYDEAEQFLAQQLKKWPANFKLLAAHGHVLSALNRTADAYEEYKNALAVAPNVPSISLLAGMLGIRLNHLDEAYYYLNQTLDHRYLVEDARFNLGVVEALRGNFAEAIKHYLQIKDKKGVYFAEARIRVAILQAQLGEIEQSRVTLAGIETSTPQQRKQIALVEGEILFKNKRYHDAIKVYSELISELPFDPEVLYYRALTYEKLGRIDLLERDLIRVLSKNPSDSMALNALGYTLADATDRYDEARTYIEQAMVIDPNNLAILDSMGWVLHRLGQHEAAIVYLKRSLAGEEGYDVVVAGHLAEALWASGKKKDARAVWKKAATEEPDNEYLKEIIERFEQTGKE